MCDVETGLFSVHDSLTEYKQSLMLLIRFFMDKSVFFSDISLKQLVFSKIYEKNSEFVIRSLTYKYSIETEEHPILYFLLNFE